MAPVAATSNESTNGSSDDLATSKVIRGVAPHPPVFQDKTEEREWLKFRLAQAFRIFGNLGYDEGVAGHITVRDNIRPDCFWVNPMGKHFSLIQPEDLLLVDHHGKVQEESGPFRLLNTAAFMIHSAIHAARPDVICAAHSHSVYGRAFSTLGKALDPLTQDACAFYNDHVVYTSYGGVVLEVEEGQNIAKLLADKKAAILQNHGILVATTSIEATIHFYVALEKSCQVQLMAEAAAATSEAKPIKIGHEDAAYTGKTVGSMMAGWFSALPQFQLLESKEGKKFKFSGSAQVSPAWI